MTTDEPRLILGDCLEVMRGMEAGSADVVVTSPPYNQLDRRVTGRRPGSLGMHEDNAFLRNVAGLGYSDYLPEPEYQRWLADVVRECLRVARGLVWINHKIRYRDGEAIHPARFLPFPIWSEVVWDRGISMALNSRRFAPSHECWWAFGRPHWWDDKANRRMSVWRISSRHECRGHPCPYPLEFASRPIAASCPPDGIVIDPFCGSGTTLIAALALGRKAVGIDRNPAYVTLARDRLATERTRIPLLA